MTRAITLNKRAIVEAPEEFKKDGILAFQVIEFVIDYFGNQIITEHDTKILTDGRQLVIGGCGFIKDGFDVASI